MAAQTSLRLVDPQPTEEQLSPAVVDLGDGGPSITYDHNNNVTSIEHEDGSITFESGGRKKKQEADSNDFFRNIADEIGDEELQLISSDLLTGIDLDIQSRKDWVETRAAGIRLLGLRLEEPRGDIGTTSAPLEGMSSIRHPLLLEATIRFQATARGELLPAAGPVKVRNDLPIKPDVPDQPGAPPQVPNPYAPPEGQVMDDLGAALEKDMNHFLTVTATEYVPDTDRMLFYVGFGGDGFKKVYYHTLKRRPVSESVDAEDIIVSDAATDIRNCGRFTHRIKMRPAMLKRMQLAGAYRDVSLAPPSPVMDLNAIDKEKAEISGHKPQAQRPKDADYEVYECYCELDLDEFAPKQFKGEGLPLPYVVTIEKNSRQILAVRRNWDEDDDQCLSKQFFVQFPFIRGLGFYGLGLIHILGNVTMALTALWRIMIDNGMFSNFPGFLFAKAAGRQNINQIRVPVGGGFPVDVPPGMRIQDAFMPIPYKETGAATTQLAQHIEEVGQRLGQTADLNIGEGRADVPVGTTMAMIEQATKIMDSVHKRLHAAQAEEFGLLKERFRENPESFWSHNRRPAHKWTVDQFKQALEQHELVPVADPNNPTSLHRIAKATIIDTLVTKYGADMDSRAALKRIMRIADIDSEGLLRAQTAPPPPDPRMAAVQSKAQAEQMKAEIDKAKLALEQQKAQAQFADADAERSFKERQNQFEMYLEQMRVQAEMIIHAHDIHRDNQTAQNDMTMKQTELAHNVISDHASNHADLQQQAAQHQMDMQAQTQKAGMEVVTNHVKNQQQLAMQRQQHEQQLELERQKHTASLENDRKMAEAKAAAVGPAERDKNDREGEKHEQSVEHNDQNMQMKTEKHKVDLQNSKTLTQAKAKAMSKPKPKPAGDKK